MTRQNNMNRARWYSSSTTLLNGETYIQGGAGGTDRPEIRDADGAFRLLSGANTNALDWMFPRNFIAPDGRVFGYDGAGRMYYVNTARLGHVRNGRTVQRTHGHRLERRHVPPGPHPAVRRQHERRGGDRHQRRGAYGHDDAAALLAPAPRQRDRHGGRQGGRAPAAATSGTS